MMFLQQRANLEPSTRASEVATTPISPRLAPPRRPAANVRHTAWPLLRPAIVVLAVIAATLAVLPPTLPVPLIDDWNYQISVRRLVEDGDLWVAPWTAATLLLQIGWGALFALPFGVNPVSLRWSTIVASIGGILAALVLFREIGITPKRAVIGALAIWLNPVMFALSYTFMTDVPYVSLMTTALFCTARAHRHGSVRWLAIGSPVAGLAFLVRPQGILIPGAILLWLLIARPGWARRQWLLTIAATLGPCLVAVGLYLAWGVRAGLPSAQSVYVDSMRAAGIVGIGDLVWKLAMVGGFYLGLFMFPIVVGAAAAVPHAWRTDTWPIRHLALLWLIGALLWMRWYIGAHDGRSFPFVPWGSILSHDGLGVLDADGERTMVFAHWVFRTIGIAAALSSAVGLLLIAGRIAPPRAIRPDSRSDDDGNSPLASMGGLLAMLGVGQCVGVVSPSLYIRQVITFDRYFLPLLPIAIALILWAMRERPMRLAPPVVALALLAVVSIVGSQDWFAFKAAQWETARWLVEEQQIPLRQVDGAAQWDGIHWYEYGLAHPYDRIPHRADDPWWLHLTAPMIDPVYIVAASPAVRPGYEVWTTRPFDSWFRSSEDARIYVWRRTERSASPTGHLTGNLQDAADTSRHSVV